jgi:hypothetical protein
MVPSTVVIPRVGSFALAFFGRTRKVQELPFAVTAGRKSFALKRIFEGVLVISVPNRLHDCAYWTLRGSLAQHCQIRSMRKIA